MVMVLLILIKYQLEKVNDDLEEILFNKIKDLDLREPEFTYNNDIQFVRAMHKCIDYINFTTLVWIECHMK